MTMQEVLSVEPCRDDVIEAICLLDPRVRNLIDESRREPHEHPFCGMDRFYDYYKIRLQRFVGWGADVMELKTSRCYDAVYHEIWDGMPHCTADCLCYPDELDEDGNRCIWPHEEFRPIPGVNANIKPIETSYNGYRFRSRTEARWAVFFDTFGIAYEYEKQTFQLGPLQYLPDFWIPIAERWLEVKPLFSYSNPHAIEKPLALAEGSRVPVVVVYGSPWPGEYRVKILCASRHGAILPQSAADWFQFEKCACGGLALLSRRRDRMHCLECVAPCQSDRDGMREAFFAARGARFEFGENGLPRRHTPDPHWTDSL